MKPRRSSGFLAVTLSCLSACTSGTKSDAPLPSGTVAEGTVTATATVESIDLATRMVTLRSSDGTTNTVKVDESARNLAQVKKGDRVVATYYESLAYAVKKAGDGAAGVDVLEVSSRAEPGAKLGAGAGGMVTMTVTIKAIDKTKPSITLQKADGSTFTVAVRHPEKLQQVKVGDLVELTYSAAVALSVEPAGK
jgi:Cu/Ag efflux protein CusF